MKTKKRITSIFAVGFLLSGCQMVTSVAHQPFSMMPSVFEHKPVVQVIGLWEPAEGVGVDNLPTRGFAGQLLFFAAGNDEPIQMNGDVQIFVFDDLGSLKEQAKPLHTFNFDQESFQAFLTETNLGYAYQLFVPYTRHDQFNTTCAIRVKVTPENGRPVFSKMASVVLSGPESPQFAIKTESRRRPTVQLASHETVAPAAAPPSQAEIAAHFGSASLPKPSANATLNTDRQRLRSTLSRVVQESKTTPTSRKSEHLFDDVQHQTVHDTPASSGSDRHPLLMDD